MEIKKVALLVRWLRCHGCVMIIGLEARLSGYRFQASRVSIPGFQGTRGYPAKYDGMYHCIIWTSKKHVKTR